MRVKKKEEKKNGKWGSDGELKIILKRRKLKK